MFDKPIKSGGIFVFAFVVPNEIYVLFFLFRFFGFFFEMAVYNLLQFHKDFFKLLIAR